MKGFWIGAIIAAAADLISKYLIFDWLKEIPGQSWTLIPGWLELVRHINRGALWGMGSGAPLLLLLLTAVIIPIVILMAYSCKERRAPLWALGLVLGGAAGNFYDRLFTEELVRFSDKPVAGVRDFIQMSWPEVYDWPVYNVADVAIVVGVAVFVLWNLFAGSEKASPGGECDRPGASAEMGNGDKSC